MGSTAFIGGHLVLDGELRRDDVVVEDGRITAIGSARAPADADTVDCEGLVVAPGFIDLQCNGAVGRDLTSNPASIAEIGRALPRFGVTAWLPTVITAPTSVRSTAIAQLLEARAAARTARDGAEPLGLHFEGPAISPGHLGAHPPRWVVEPEALAAEVVEWIDSGAVALVTLAPELPGALGLVERLTEGGVTVSAGHTGMRPADLTTARRAGLAYTTHLFNAMAPFTHRDPGPIGAVLADDAVVAGLICDGIHVDPAAVAMARAALGSGRLSLVSDASPALGAPYGRFDLGGFELVHDERGVRTVDGVLAGSALPLDRAVRNLMSFTGCGLVEAVDTVTTTPADLLGATDRGRLRVGARGDLTILDPAGGLVRTVIAGSTAWPHP